MARRRRLDAPDPSALAQLTDDLKDKRYDSPILGAGAPPIAHVAAEAAGAAARDLAQARQRAGAAEAEASQWREAVGAGRVLAEIPVTAISAEHLIRDRAQCDDEPMRELRESIRANGLRLPLEVAEIGEGRYGLISGWRRLQALRALWIETGDPRFSHARALLRAPQEAREAYAAMVEENEIRADLSYYERGRIAVLTAGVGVFPSVEDAVSALFATGSRARRSKIRSFSRIHEELGDLLRFASALSERVGLRVAQALKEGHGAAIRDYLILSAAQSAQEEIAALERALSMAGDVAPQPSPARKPRRAAPHKEALQPGLSMERRAGADGFTLRFTGERADPAMMEKLTAWIRTRLG